ncbi:MAG: heme biosynthesis HemY N-terminal domain-containing protein [Alphaproteobacteria bacterium]
MRWIVSFFVLVILAIAAWLFVREHPGTVMVEWLGTRIEAGIGVAIVAMLLVVVAVILLFQLFRLVVFSPHRLARWFGRRRERKGLHALSMGMVAVAAGDPEEAGRQSRRASHMLTGVPLSNLLSAQAAQLKGDEDAARRYFEAMLDDPETEFLGLRGLLMQALRARDDARALKLAERARALRPRSPWLLQTLAELQTRNGDWQDALETTGTARRLGAYDDDEANRRMAIIQSQASRALEQGNDQERALAFARHAHKIAPGFVPAAIQLAHLHAARGDVKRAAEVLARTWTLTPHPELATACRRLYPGETPIGLYKRLTALTKGAPDSSESRLVLARAAAEAGHYDEARGQLDGVDDAVGGARRYRLLAEIEERQTGDSAAARRWLDKAAAFGQQQGWTCADCGHVTQDWHSHCPSCGAFGTIRWHQFGPEQLLLPPDLPPLPPADPPAVPTQQVDEAVAAEPPAVSAASAKPAEVVAPAK